MDEGMPNNNEGGNNDGNNNNNNGGNGEGAGVAEGVMLEEVPESEGGFKVITMQVIN